MARPKLEDRPSKVNRADRPKKVSINGYRNILGVGGLEEGWHYCWVNDTNVDRYQSAYYDFVEHEVVIGDRKVDAASQIGGRISKAVGNGVTAYLMRCTEEDYQEEMANVHGEADAIERALLDTSRSKTKDDGHYGEVQIGFSPKGRVGSLIK